jgi:hypothetical protein
VNQNYTDSVGAYDCMKNISATVINGTHLTCLTIATQNGSPALVSVSMDNGMTWSGTASIDVAPAFEWALGRRPYYRETEGAIIYTVHPSLVAGIAMTTRVQLEGRLRPHHGNESDMLSSLYFDQHTTVGVATAAEKPLVQTILMVGKENSKGEVSFSLAGMPSTVYEDFVLTVSIGTQKATKWKRFHRAPVPPDGSNSNVTLFAVDHTTAGMLMGQAESPWLPFTALGWFNSPFESVPDTSVYRFVQRIISAADWRGHSVLKFLT